MKAWSGVHGYSSADATKSHGAKPTAQNGWLLLSAKEENRQQISHFLILIKNSRHEQSRLLFFGKFTKNKEKVKLNIKNSENFFGVLSFLYIFAP